MTKATIEDSATAEIINEQFTNARNVIQSTLNDAHKDGFIDLENGQALMDLFDDYAATAQQYLQDSTARFESEKGLAAMAILNMVTIALAAGSREPNLASNKLQELQRNRATKARAAKQPDSDAKKEIIAEEVERWLQQHPNRAKWKGNAIAKEIFETVNVRLTVSRLDSFGKANSLAKPIRAYLKTRTAN